MRFYGAGRGGGRSWKMGLRRLSSAVRRHLEDEGDWAFSSEWWGSASDDGHTVFRSFSAHGNGVVSVVAYPASTPAPEQWLAVEKWLQERYAKIHPEFDHHGEFKILGYQWRVLRFNDNTRQSTAKVMASYRKSDPTSLYLMQQPHCLAVPYLKSMVSVGLTTLASSSYDLSEAVLGKRSLKVLCIGHGGGSLPLFLASKISGATVHVVDIDPVVISASIQAMGFPSSTVKGKSGCSFTRPPDIDKLLWEGIHDRLFLYRCDAEDFIIENRNVYDLVFIDAYDGDDIFPYKLWDSDSLFLKHLKHRIHPLHGTVVVNLHSDSDLLTIDTRNNSPFESILPMGKYVSRICRAYKHQFGLAFAVSVPWLCNVTLVACRSELFGSGLQGPLANRNLVLSTLISKSYLVESAICLPFPCLEYIKRGFLLIE
ncbi:uncharacterized protein LOC109707571 isoform X1 [Ananas comosus]|uniref:Uncharacterized protein LOC109707571 isoform X1 n=1 Tax=Ananas comosus TaxID=4615 RepID=A0A6P5ELS8_ANACO|nr:uncharacterized protein LOC109707571 isoform X1 [Ananas comosus]